MKKKPSSGKPEIKAIIFDLGNVLVNYDVKRAVKQFSKACRLSAIEIWARCFTSKKEKAYTMGQISSREFYEFACRTLKLDADFETFRHYWNNIFEENPGMEELLVKLKARYPLYLLSNTNEMHFDFIRENYAHLLRHFQTLFTSHELGCRKPDRLIYRKVIERIGYLPEETAFFDDMPAFVEGARKSGIRAVRFTTLRQLLKELKKLDIDV